MKNFKQLTEQGEKKETPKKINFKSKAIKVAELEERKEMLVFSAPWNWC